MIITSTRRWVRSWPWSKLVSIGMVNLATFVWATNMVLGRWLRDDIGPVTISAGRFLIGGVIILMSGGGLNIGGGIWG